MLFRSETIWLQSEINSTIADKPWTIWVSLECRRHDQWCRHDVFRSGDGRGMASGFYQALFLTQCGPTVNINLAFTCFYLPLNFVEFASKYLRKDIRKGLSQDEVRAFTRIVRNMLSTWNEPLSLSR